MIWIFLARSFSRISNAMSYAGLIPFNGGLQMRRLRSEVSAMAWRSLVFFDRSLVGTFGFDFDF